MQIAASPVDSRAALWRLAAGTGVTMLMGSAPWMASVLIADFVSDFGISRADAAYPYIMVMLGYFLSAPVWAILLNRWGLHVILAIAAVLGVISYLIAAHTTHYGLFCLCFCGAGFASSVAGPPMIADMTFWFRRWRGFAVSIVSGGNMVSGLVWLQVVGLSRDLADWRLAFQLLAAALVLVLPLAWAMRARPSPQAAAPSNVSRGEAAGQDGVVIGVLMVVALICCVAMAIPQVHLVAICLDIGLNADQSASILSAMLLTSLVSRLFCATIYDRVGPQRMLIGCSLLQAFALLFYATSGSFMEVGAVTLLFGLAQGGLLPAYPLLVRRYVSLSRVSMGISLMSLATIGGMIVGSWAAGHLYGVFGTYAAPLQMGFVANLANVGVVALLVLWLSRRGA